MRTVILIITTFLCTTTLCAQVQQPVQWEYAELDVISGAPALWTAGDSVRLQGALAQPQYLQPEHRCSSQRRMLRPWKPRAAVHMALRLFQTSASHGPARRGRSKRGIRQ